MRQRDTNTLAVKGYYQLKIRACVKEIRDGNGLIGSRFIFIYQTVLSRWGMPAGHPKVSRRGLVAFVCAFLNVSKYMYEGWNFNNGKYLFTTDTK